MKFLCMFAMLAVLTSQAWADEEKKEMTEEEFAVELVQKLGFVNDPSLDLTKEMELVKALLGQVRNFQLRADRFRSVLNGKASATSSGAVEAGKGGATLVYQVPVTAPGTSEINAERSGGAQYWTFQGEPTQFIKGEGAWNAVRVMLSFRDAGIKRLTVSVPEGGRFGGMSVNMESGRSLLPPGGLGKSKLNHRTLMATLARILGKLNRLKPKADVKPVSLRPMENSKAKLKIAPLVFILKNIRAGAFAFRLKNGGPITGMRINGKDISTQLPNLPQPEGEEDGKGAFVTLGEGEHRIEVPVSSSEPTELEMEELDESGAAYENVLADLGFSSSNLDQTVNSEELYQILERLRLILFPLHKRQIALEVLNTKDPKKEQDTLRNLWEFRFPSARRRVSPVLPQEGQN